MKGMLLIEVHPWRGFMRARDLFFIEIRLGFVTVALARTLVSDRLRSFINMLRIGRSDD
jgi:hypothetical protein